MSQSGAREISYWMAQPAGRRRFRTLAEAERTADIINRAIDEGLLDQERVSVVAYGQDETSSGRAENLKAAEQLLSSALTLLGEIDGLEPWIAEDVESAHEAVWRVINRA